MSEVEFSGGREHRRGLDGLRALAVACVAWYHWRPSSFAGSSIPWAGLGVQTFFVISGFLITGILLDQRSESARAFVLQRFYIRRVLRIFPLFYGTLVVAFIAGARGVHETWPWHASYLSNIYFYRWGWVGQLSHFWSLAVEEQFYLFWPLVIIFLPARFLLPTILLSIVGARVFESSLTAAYPALNAGILMPSCMSALGMGAFLAYGERRKLPMQAIAIGLLACAAVGYALWHVSERFQPIGRTAWDCALGWLVYSSARGVRGPFGWLLESAPLRYLGRISYGLYMFHNFGGAIWWQMSRWLGNPAWLGWMYATPVIRIAGLAALTIGLASLSWHFFERPINDLKRTFPYPTRAEREPRTEPALIASPARSHSPSPV